ncbi:MAG: ankyrin repeat domain-containing protein [Elusimicrobiaceae bacterium]|nr:ankyrin repeat domain-containing protein [Elusimicrobiaceae bacterium]
MKKILFINLLSLTLFGGCLQNSNENNIKNNTDSNQSIIAYLKQEGLSITNSTYLSDCTQEEMNMIEEYRYIGHRYNEDKEDCNRRKQDKKNFPKWLKLAEKNPDIRNERGQTLLMTLGGQPVINFYGPTNKQMQIALTKILLQKGADPNLTDPAGLTALMYACFVWTDILYQVPLERIRLLLKAGAKPNMVNKDGETALSYAVHFIQRETVPLLLEAGADPNIANSKGVTPLHIACDGGKVEMVRMLLEAGADPNLKDEEGHTPLWEAERFGKANATNPEAISEVNSIKKLLIDAGAETK